MVQKMNIKFDEEAAITMLNDYYEMLRLMKEELKETKETQKGMSLQIKVLGERCTAIEDKNKIKAAAKKAHSAVKRDEMARVGKIV